MLNVFDLIDIGSKMSRTSEDSLFACRILNFWFLILKFLILKTFRLLVFAFYQVLCPHNIGDGGSATDSLSNRGDSANKLIGYLTAPAACK